MKLRTIVKIAITSSVVLLCSGFALYSFFRLSAAEGQKDFNLYELVPSTTSAVFVTDDVLEFVAEVDELTCSKNQQYLYVSKLFSYLKQSLYALSEDTPHGLSLQMNQMFSADKVRIYICVQICLPTPYPHLFTKEKR